VLSLVNCRFIIIKHVAASFICSPSSALGLEEPGNAVETSAPELEKELDVAASGVVPATTMLVESLVPQEPPEPITTEDGGPTLRSNHPWGRGLQPKKSP
jgi:hypothetical protein